VISRGLALASVSALVATLLVAANTTASAAKTTQAQPTVLYVGTFDGITPPTNDFSTIQAAVDAAKQGDWILIAPGDYHESDDSGITTASEDTRTGWYGGVVINTPGLHLRGMNRNSVIVDGTLANADNAGLPCSSAPGDQNFLHGLGRNGILVWKADNVSIDNLTVCNFLNGTAPGGNGGNEIWWNGEPGKGKVGITGYEGSYLTATSTYFANSDPSQANICDTCALYGVFSSNAGGGTWDQLYANNFADSGAYIGACKDQCDSTIEHAQFEYNALGYSGTNSGGRLVIETSTFDNNKEGLDTNTAVTGDPPPPQSGRCPTHGAVPGSVLIPGGVRSCWVFENNLVEDNNDPNVPIEGTAGLGPTGTGMTISGGRFDVVTDNQFAGNGAWGILFAPYPDSNLSSDGRTCKGLRGWNVSSLGISGVSCVLDPWGDALLDNQFSGNGSFGNPSNSDFGDLVAGGPERVNCFAGNTEWNSSFTVQTGAATDANAIDGLGQLTPATCSGITRTDRTPLLGADTDGTLLSQAECDAGVLSGPPFCEHASYPQSTVVTMHPLPGASGLEAPSSTDLATMPNPCAGVPTNLWCPGDSPAAKTQQPAAKTQQTAATTQQPAATTRSRREHKS
jgi:hypothetical protein